MTAIAYDASSGTPKEIGRAGTTVSLSLPALLSHLNPALSLGASQSFNVTVSGQLPPNVSYNWTVIGSGQVNGGSSAKTSIPSVEYKAASSVGSDTLTVQVTDASGSLLARTGTTITVGAKVAISPNEPSRRVL